MSSYLYTIISILYLITKCNSENLTCSSSRTENSCVCRVKFDELTSMASLEAQCQYLQLQNFPSVIAEDVISSLDLSHNDFEELQDVTLSHFSQSLTSLIFCHNSITDMDPHFSFAFPNLMNLDLSHNYIRSLEPEGLFVALDKLQILDLSYNEIEAVTDGIFEKLVSLRKLDLSYNPLHQVFQDPNGLGKLLINENLNYLGLDNVGISSIHPKDWDHFKSLEHLSIADNPIKEVPQTSRSLKYLDISGTNITDLHENSLQYTELKILKMIRMENLTAISPYVFFNLGNLTELILTDSPKLTEFSAVAFGALDRNTFPRELRKFDLARNRLSTLNETYKFIFQEMEVADISFNPWSCNCHVLWMKEMDSIMPRKYDIRCASPDEMVNKIVVNLEPKDVPTCYPGIYGKKSHQTALLILLLLVFALIVVIIYLCLYSPSWSIKIGSTKMSRDSPYSINNEQT